MVNLSEITADQEARLRELATEGYYNWKAKATEESRAASMAEMELFKNDPAFAEERLAVF